MAFPDDNILSTNTNLPHAYMGIVVDRDDPKDLFRVRFRIPGLLDPHGPWAKPFATGGGGSKNNGFFAVPEVGAVVLVLFLNGEVEKPVYTPAYWGAPDGESELPDEATSPDVRVWATERYRIEISEEEGGQRLRMRDVVTGDQVNMDGEEGTVTISGTSRVLLQSVGRVEIDALEVVIKGRIVRPIDDPI